MHRVLTPGYWIIYYADNKFSSEDGTPWEAPRQGIQVIAEQHDQVGYRLSHGNDYYYFEQESGGWASCDLFGLYDHLIRAKYPCPGFGRMMSENDWDELFTKVKVDLGDKQGWKTVELKNVRKLKI